MMKTKRCPSMKWSSWFVFWLQDFFRLKVLEVEFLKKSSKLDSHIPVAMSLSYTILDYKENLGILFIILCFSLSLSLFFSFTLSLPGRSCEVILSINLSFKVCKIRKALIFLPIIILLFKNAGNERRIN